MVLVVRIHGHLKKLREMKMARPNSEYRSARRNKRFGRLPKGHGNTTPRFVRKSKKKPMHRAEFLISYRDATQKFVWIEDLDKGISVTNDVENVVRYLLYLTDPEHRFFYLDTSGNLDELVHDGSRFTGFRPTSSANRTVLSAEDKDWYLNSPESKVSNQVKKEVEEYYETIREE